MEKKLGRLPRKYDPRVPKMHAVLRHLPPLPTPPVTLSYDKHLPDKLGMMLNDALGCCTCAALYHARQLWTGNANPPMITESDENVQALYEQACGYDPKDPSTDQGGVEQDVLKFLMKTGYPIGATGERQKILGFIEADTRNLDDLKRVIYEFGTAYVGIEITQEIMDNADNINRAWDDDGGASIGGHAIILTGYNLDYFYATSWGNPGYKLTHAFMGKYLDEAYGIFDPSWIEKNGETPLGLTPDMIDGIMEGLKEHR